MKFAVTAEGTRGDIFPMLALAKRFEAAGHDVLFCAPPDFAEATAERELAFHPVGRDIREYLTAEAAALHGGVLAMARVAGQLFKDNVGRQFSDLYAGARDCDGIVSAGTQIAASSVAEALGVPHRFVAYDPTLLRSDMHPPVFFPHPNTPRWANRLLWRIQGRLLQLGMGRSVNRARRSLGLASTRDLYRLMLGVRPLLATDHRLAGVPEDVEGVDCIGCLHPFEEAPLPEKLSAFLDSGPEPVYIGFGSMTDPDPKRSTAMLLDAIDLAGVRAVISEGWAGLGGIALPGHVMVIGAVDHSTLFQRVRAIVHHGGAGTTTTAARAGRPQVLVPHILDQFHWAARVGRLGIGPPPLKRRHLTAQGLAYSLRAVCENEWLASNASELGVLLRADLSSRMDPIAALTRSMTGAPKGSVTERQ
jgi:UDP:flavonoid glycosyltransferase YjiC (YdhE family)